MKNQFRLDFCKGDSAAILIVAMLAIVCALILIPKGHSDVHMVQIYQNGCLIRELPLETNAVFQVDGDYRNTVTILDGRASITESDCPGEDCVHSGWISSPVRSIVCLPNRVEIRISGESAVDFAVR